MEEMVLEIGFMKRYHSEHVITYQQYELIEVHIVMYMIMIWKNWDKFELLLVGTVQQEKMEADAREALWREELIEEIEQKVGGLRELEETKEEELVK